MKIFATLQENKENRADKRRIIWQQAEEIFHRNYEEIRCLANQIGKAIKKTGDGSDTPKECVLLFRELIKYETEGIQTWSITHKEGSTITRNAFTYILTLAAKIGRDIRYSGCDDRDKLMEYVSIKCTSEFEQLIAFEKRGK